MLFLGTCARGGEDFYLLMFAAQRTPNDPDFSHSWASFVRVSWTGNGPCPHNPVLEVRTISWLPANLAVRTFAIAPERGRNFDLETTIRFHLDVQARVSMWGPYRIEPDLYCRAVKQITLLESGEMKYKTSDGLNYSDRVCNCGHALTALTDRPKLILGSPGWGDMASVYILDNKFSPWIIGQNTYPWVACAIGLDRYPIVFRNGK
jgi:hypothetical protein